MSARQEALLKRWLNRAGHPTKKGTKLDISYTPSVNHPPYYAPPNSRIRFGGLFFEWRQTLDDYIDEKKNARAVEQAKKIRIALDS